MYAEIIYETGSHSVGCYEDEKQAIAAAEAAHARAMEGGTILPDVPIAAERVKRVLMYDRHPADFGSTQMVSKEDASARIATALKAAEEGDLVHLPTVEEGLREMTYPMVVSGPHESNYKAKEVKELKGAWQ